MEKKLQHILAEDYLQIKENPRLLVKTKLDLVLALVDIYPSYVQSKEEGQEDLDLLFIEVLSINARYERFLTTLKTLCQKLLLSKKISKEDADNAIKELSTTELLTIQDLPEDEKKLEVEILQTYCTNATLSSGIIQEGAEIDLVELEEQNFDPRVVEHLKKTAFDQFCLQIRVPVPEKYEEMMAMKPVFKNSEENDMVTDAGKVGSKNLIAVKYYNARRMDRLAFPRFAEFLEDHSGSSVRHVSNEHHESIKVVNCSVDNKNVKVRLKMWEGEVRGEIV